MPTSTKTYAAPKCAADYVGMTSTGRDPVNYSDATGMAFVIGEFASEESLNAASAPASESERTFSIAIPGSSARASARRVRINSVHLTDDVARINSVPQKFSSIAFSSSSDDSVERSPAWSEQYAKRAGDSGTTILPLGGPSEKYHRSVRAVSLLAALSEAQKNAAQGGVPRPRYGHRITFRRLADAWVRDTVGMSVIKLAVMHRAYQQIIGMGPVAIPLLLEELRDRPEHWMWALSVLAEEDPAAGTHSFAAARAAWLRWGQEKGYLGAD